MSGAVGSVEWMMTEGQSQHPAVLGKPIDTRTFQQYDRNNATARQQVLNARDSLAPIFRKPDIAGYDDFMKRFNAGEDTSADERQTVQAAMGVIPLAGITKTVQELAHEIARANAALPYSQGGLGLKESNTALERARALGFKTAPSQEVYHSARGDWSSNVVDPALSDLGFHVGTLEQAENRAKAFGAGGVNIGEGANIMPLMINKYANMLKLNDVGTFHADGIAPQLEKKGFIAKGKGKQIEKEIDADYKLRRQYDDQMRDILSQQEYDGIKYANEQEGRGMSYAVTNPSVIRSRFAAFDPKRATEADILASGLLGTVGYSAIHGREE